MIHIRVEPPTRAAWQEYSQVSIAFLVESRYRIESIENGLGGWRLTEEPVEHPYIKDYDKRDGEGPNQWANRYDISNWGILSAFEGPKRIGGAVIAFNTPGLYMLEGRPDVAALWDIRVDPAHRRKGIGSLLFAQASSWASARQCTTLKIETQNINVPACMFYARMGCQLRAIHTDTYPDLPDETQLLWYRHL